MNKLKIIICQIRNLVQDAYPQVNVPKKWQLADKLALPENPFKLEMSATWTRKTEVLKYSAQFQCITVEIKERFETQNPPVWPPTKPPTDRHSTNFTKEHKSLKASHQWSYWSQVSLFNLHEKKTGKVKFSFKIKYCKRFKLIMLIQLVCLLSYFISRDVTLEYYLFEM